jgi:hypothetical protein
VNRIVATPIARLETIQIVIVTARPPSWVTGMPRPEKIPPKNS